MFVLFVFDLPLIRWSCGLEATSGYTFQSKNLFNGSDCKKIQIKIGISNKIIDIKIKFVFTIVSSSQSTLNCFFIIIIVYHCSVSGQTWTFIFESCLRFERWSLCVCSASLCCQSVWMNLSPTLTDADVDAQRERNRAGKTRLSDSATRGEKYLPTKVSLDLPWIGIPEFQGLLGSAWKGLRGFIITD